MSIGSSRSLSAPPTIEPLCARLFVRAHSPKPFVPCTLQTLSIIPENCPNQAPVFSSTCALLENRVSAISRVSNHFHTLRKKPGVVFYHPLLQIPCSFRRPFDSAQAASLASPRRHHLTPLESILTEMRIPNSFRSNTYEKPRSGGATTSSRSIVERLSDCHRSRVTNHESRCLY